MTPTRLSNPEPAHRVILATVKGDDVTPSHADRREEQLKNNIWQEAINGGSQMCRFVNTKDSAWSIVNLILEKGAIDLSRIQQELEKICNGLQNPEQIGRAGFFSFLFRYRSRH